ncbi:hypothetical protein [Cedecea neteri]|uniref:hypothetical protein n=1 Tax=Cedecea neteri TaxID=158822 RepID=UPI00289D55C9|nr:hypothetical protein [Cedecea neteri]
MINFVLFLLAVALLIWIAKTLKVSKKTIITIAKMAGVVGVLLVAGAIGFSKYESYQSEQYTKASNQKLTDYVNSLDQQAESLKKQVSELLNVPWVTGNDREALEKMNPTDRVLYMPDLAKYATDLRKARNLFTIYPAYSSSSPLRAATVQHLDQPLAGESDIKIIYVPFMIDAGEASTLVSLGYYSSVAHNVYNLDGTKIYRPTKRTWVTPDYLQSQAFKGTN